MVAEKGHIYDLIRQFSMQDHFLLDRSLGGLDIEILPFLF